MKISATELYFEIHTLNMLHWKLHPWSPCNLRHLSSYNWLYLLTFRHGLVATPGWPHSVSMATKCHKMGDNGWFAKAHVSDDYYTPIGWGVSAAEVSIHLLEEPIPAIEQPVRGQPRNLKVQGLRGESRSERDCRRTGEQSYTAFKIVLLCVWKKVCVHCTYVFLLTPRILSGHSEGGSWGDVSVLLIQIG